MTVAQVRGVVSTRTPAEALAFVDGYEAGLDQGRREAAAAIRARIATWPDYSGVGWHGAAYSMHDCATGIEGGAADAGEKEA